jgi:hypothetical protein
MRRFRTLAAATLPLAPGITLGLGLAAVPAQAVDSLTGICNTPADAYCWHVMPTGATDLWARDISSDPRQDFQAVYVGAKSSTGCGLSGNIGVYEFFSTYKSGDSTAQGTLYALGTEGVDSQMTVVHHSSGDYSSWGQVVVG